MVRTIQGLRYIRLLDFRHDFTTGLIKRREELTHAHCMCTSLARIVICVPPCMQSTLGLVGNMSTDT